MNAELVLSVLSDGGYRKHIETLRSRLAQARRDVHDRLRNLGIEPWIEPQAGMFLWCRLPDGIDATDIARASLERGVVMAPGNAFSLSHAASGFMRFNVSQCLDPTVFDVLRAVLKPGK